MAALYAWPALPRSVSEKHLNSAVLFLFPLPDKSHRKLRIIRSFLTGEAVFQRASPRASPRASINSDKLHKSLTPFLMPSSTRMPYSLNRSSFSFLPITLLHIVCNRDNTSSSALIR